MEFECIETQRLILRKLTPEVYDYIYANYSDEECMEHLGLKSHKELKTEKEKYKLGLKAYDRTFVIFQMIEKESNSIIGMTGFVRYYPAHFRAELGYAIDNESNKRKGFMFEATEPLIEYGFEKLNLIRIEALAGPNNLASLKILKRLGFEEEGLLKKHFVRDGIAEDSVAFALFKK